MQRPSTLRDGDLVLSGLTLLGLVGVISLTVGVLWPGAGEGRAYEKAKFRERPAVSVGVRLAVEDGRISRTAVAVGSLTDIPLLVPEAAAALDGAPAGTDGELTQRLERAGEAFGRLEAVEDLDGSADFKRHLAGVLLGRATRAAGHLYAMLRTPSWPSRINPRRT